MQIPTSSLLVCAGAAACWLAVASPLQANAQSSTNVTEQFGGLPPASPPLSAAEANPFQYSPVPPASPGLAFAKQEVPPPSPPATPVKPSVRPKPDWSALGQKPGPALEASRAPMPPKGPLVFKPLEAPPLPISAEKQAQLEELLRKYKADELSPEQYHAQRAKTLAGL